MRWDESEMEACIDSDVLRWAREHAGKSLEEVAQLPGLENLADIEEGLTRATIDQADRLANLYGLTLGALYLPLEMLVTHMQGLEEERAEEARKAQALAERARPWRAVGQAVLDANGRKVCDVDDEVLPGIIVEAVNHYGEEAEE